MCISCFFLNTKTIGFWQGLGIHDRALIRYKDSMLMKTYKIYCFPRKSTTNKSHLMKSHLLKHTVCARPKMSHQVNSFKRHAMNKQYCHALDGYVLCLRNVIYPRNVHRGILPFHRSLWRIRWARVRRKHKLKRQFCVIILHK